MAVTFSASGTASAGGVQQSYALVHAALLEGQLSDIRDNTIGTYINEPTPFWLMAMLWCSTLLAPLPTLPRPLHLLLTSFKA